MATGGNFRHKNIRFNCREFTMKNKRNIILILLLLSFTLSCRSLYFYEIQGEGFFPQNDSNIKYRKSCNGVTFVLYAQAARPDLCVVVLEIHNKSYDLVKYKLEQLHLMGDHKYYSFLNADVDGKYVKQDYECKIPKGKMTSIIFRAEITGMTERSKEIKLNIGKFELSDGDNIIDIKSVLLTNLKYYRSSTLK